MIKYITQKTILSKSYKILPKWSHWLSYPVCLSVCLSVCMAFSVCLSSRLLVLIIPVRCFFHCSFAFKSSLWRLTSPGFASSPFYKIQKPIIICYIKFIHLQEFYCIHWWGEWNYLQCNKPLNWKSSCSRYIPKRKLKSPAIYTVMSRPVNSNIPFMRESNSPLCRTSE